MVLEGTVVARHRGLYVVDARAGSLRRVVLATPVRGVRGVRRGDVVRVEVASLYDLEDARITHLGRKPIPIA